MILILTDQFDTHADKVINYFKENNTPFFRLDLDVEALKKTIISFNGSTWTIQQNDIKISTSLIKAVWLRRAFVELTLEEMKYQENDFKIWKNEWNKTLNGLYLSLKQKIWLNPVDKAYKGENKYYQMELAKKIGFEVPDTLISNNKEDLLSFSKKYKKVVFKLMTQEFYADDKGNYQGLFVNIINENHLNKFNEIEENPIVLQKYIEKSFEVRYTIVGDKHFVCKIDSQNSNKTKVDWRRYDIPNTPHYQIMPPDIIREKVTLLLKTMELNYGALDFVVTEKNEWIFLEINCLGQWLWIEDLTGMPISNEIGSWYRQKLSETEKEVIYNESIRN